MSTGTSNDKDQNPNLTIKRKEVLVLREDSGLGSPGNAANVRQTGALGGFF